VPDAPAASLVERDPRPSPQRLLDDLVPPPHFAAARFETYRPDPSQPTQAEAVEALRDRAGRWSGAKGGSRGGSKGGGGALAKLFGRSGGSGGSGGGGKEGIYLDGGFGVGKTHLLTSLFHAVDSPSSPAAYGTFVEYTNLAGALGFRQAVEALSAKRLVCIDEFELDDPGDTVLMSRLLRELSDAGTALAATSNTLPDALGEGRFAAEDFLREIQAVASRFDVFRVDGEDYRHRGLPTPPAPATDEQVRERAQAARERGEGAVLDSFDALAGHLATVHPSRYGALLDGVSSVHWTGVQPISDQSVALRLVVLGDRMYDRDLPLVASGAPLDQLFPEELMRGGYRKKYARAVSRLTALAREGAAA
jgi:cell division protein ZapE